MKYLRLIFLAFVLFCIGYAVKGAVYTVSDGTMTVTENTETHVVTVTWAFGRRDDGGGDPDNWYTGGSIIKTDANGSNTNLGTAFNEHSVHSGWGSSPWTVTGSTTFTRDPNSWYRVRIYKSNDANVFLENNATWWAPDPVTEKRVRIAGTHTGERPIRLVLRSGESDVVGSIDVQPGASYDQTFTVTEAQETAGLHLDTFVQDSFQDGVWVQKETFDTATATKVGTAEVSGVTLPAGGIPDASWEAYSNRGPSSAAPSASTSSTSAWTASNVTTTTTDQERLDKATYREGVDKLERVLQGKASEVPSAPTTPGTPAFTAPANPNRLASKLPTAPTIAAPSAPVTAITVALEIPGITVAPVTIDFDRPGFSGPVSIFRGIMLAVMSLIYLVLSIRTVRGAFAGK